jgi:membrane protein required for colicin V production
MNGFDGAVIVVGLVLCLVGAIKGAVKVAVGIASLVLAFVLAVWFDGVAGSLYAGVFAGEGARRIAGFATIFLGVLIVGTLIGWIVVKALAKAKLRWIDRLAGAALGAVATILMFGALAVPLAAYLPESSGLLRDSRLAPHVVRLARLIDGSVPESVRVRFRQRMGRLEQAWASRQD